MKRRIIGVLAAAALVGLSAAVTPAIAAEPQGAAYVALGDSVAAGNGNLPYLDPACLRSKKSYPMVLAKELGLAVVSKACTEASTADVALNQLGDLGPDTQLVTLTVGVNNVQFDGDPAPDWGDALGACSNKSPLPPEYCEILLGVALNTLATLPQNIEALIEAIRADAPSARIVVTGYPLLFAEVTKKCSVGSGVSFGAAETVLINDAVTKANVLIAQGVTMAGDPDAEYVDVNLDVGDVDGFEGHGLCGAGQHWISHLIPPNATTGDRGFHPTSVGLAAFAAILAEVIAG